MIKLPKLPLFVHCVRFFTAVLWFNRFDMFWYVFLILLSRPPNSTLLATYFWNPIPQKSYSGNMIAFPIQQPRSGEWHLQRLVTRADLSNTTTVTSGVGKFFVQMALSQIGSLNWKCKLTTAIQAFCLRKGRMGGKVTVSLIVKRGRIGEILS